MTDNQSPEQIAKANRLRLTKEEAARAMEDVQREANHVRKNMARLRELRLAKEAAEQTAVESKNKAKKVEGGRLSGRPLSFHRIHLKRAFSFGDLLNLPQ